MRNKEKLPEILRLAEPQLPCHDAGLRQPDHPPDIASVSPEDIAGAEVGRARPTEPDVNVPELFAYDHIERIAPAARDLDNPAAFLCDHNGFRQHPVRWPALASPAPANRLRIPGLFLRLWFRFRFRIRCPGRLAPRRCPFFPDMPPRPLQLFVLLLLFVLRSTGRALRRLVGRFLCLPFFCFAVLHTSNT